MGTDREPVAPTNADLECLNQWAPDTPGYSSDEQLIERVLILCAHHGFARVQQLMTDIYAIWLDRDKIAAYQQARNAYLNNHPRHNGNTGNTGK